MSDEQIPPVSAKTVVEEHDYLLKRHGHEGKKALLEFYRDFLEQAASTTDFREAWQVWMELRRKRFNDNVL